MGKWILIPDSFKGTMSSEEICTVMAAALRRHLPEADIVSVPVADGGEGSVDAFLTALGGRREEVPCTGPDGRPILRPFAGWDRSGGDGGSCRPSADGGAPMR